MKKLSFWDFRTAANQTAWSGVEQGTAIKYSVAEKRNQVNIKEEYVMSTEKHVLEKRVYKWAKHRLASTSPCKKIKQKIPYIYIYIYKWKGWAL